MRDKEKAVLAVGGLGLAGLAGYLLTRKVKATPPEGAAVGIEIIGPGIPLKYSPSVQYPSPVIVLEGESYIVRVTVTNLTTKAGQPWEATLGITVYADGAVVYFFPTVFVAEYFSAGQTRFFDYPMNVPLGYGGQSGKVWALIKDPTGVELARVSELVTIESVAIIYGAEVIIGI